MEKLRQYYPALVAVIVGLGFSVWRLAEADWDPVALAELGTRFSEANPQGSEGYDGQFSYYIALDPDPSQIGPLLDNAPYRYQRIGYPLLARVVALGQPDLIPWSLLLVNLVAHGLGTYAFIMLLDRFGKPRHYALIYGLWVGLIAAVGVDMPEPLAFALAIGSIVFFYQGRAFLAAVMITASVLTREALLPFMLAMLLASLWKRDRRHSLGLVTGLVVFAAWQLWLKLTFGDFGLGTGGAGDSGLEWIPFMGLFRIAEESLKVMGLFVIIFGPTVILPAAWGVYSAVVDLIKRRIDFEGWLLLVNSTAVIFLPYSTFREPLALVRLATGLVVSVVLYAVGLDMRRPLNYGMFWIALLVLLAQ